MRYVLLCLFALAFWETAQAQYGLLDARAKQAPESVADTPQNLVTYLTKDLTDPSQKARVLAVWTAFQVQRDGYRRKILIQYSNRNARAPEPLPNDVFKTRIGTPQEFADLFQQLATLAGLESVVIDGFAGYDIPSFRYQDPVYAAGEVILRRYSNHTNYPLQRYRAAWNAVKIKDDWKLVDTYWMIAANHLYAAQDISSDRAMRRFLDKRMNRLPSRAELTRGKRINNDFFFAPPRRFVKTHFPLDSRWQLLPVPVSWSSFTN